MITSLTQRQLKKLVSDDYLRPAMNGAFYEPKLSRITVTDGHKLVMFDVTAQDDDVECIIPIDVFPTSMPKGRDSCTYEIKDNIISRKDTLTGLVQHQEEIINEKYPNYQGIIPNYDEYSPIGFSINNLIDLLVGIKDKETSLITLRIESKNRAVLFEYGNVRGLIMPMIINNH